MNKRKVVKYSGCLCILSMATAVSLCVVGSKDANATVGGGALFSLKKMFRGIGDSVNSGVVGLKKIVSSKTSSGLKNRGLSVRPSAFGSGYKNVLLVSPDGIRKVYPNQPSNPKEKLLWLGTQGFGIQKYVGSDGSEHGFIYRSNPQSESGKLSGLKLSTPQTPTPTTRTVTKIKLTSTGSPSTKSSSSGASTSTSSTTTGTSGTSTTSVSSGGTSVSTSTQTPTTTTVTTSTQTTGIGTAPVQTPSSRAQTIVVTSTETTPTSTVSPSLSTGTTSSISTGTTTATSSGSSTKTPTSSTSTLSGVKLSSPQPTPNSRSVIKLKETST